jgi:hypothetical protein
MRISALASLVPFALFAGVAALIASIACSNQGEGDYCDLLNGDNDCQSGLICTTPPGLAGMPGTNTRCCPPSAAQATKAVCMGAANDSGPPTEVGDVFVEASPDASVADGPSSDGPAPEASTEAGPSEAGADAGPAPSADASDGAPE